MKARITLAVLFLMAGGASAYPPPQSQQVSQKKVKQVQASQLLESTSGELVPTADNHWSLVAQSFQTGNFSGQMSPNGQFVPQLPTQGALELWRPVTARISGLDSAWPSLGNVRHTSTWSTGPANTGSWYSMIQDSPCYRFHGPVRGALDQGSPNLCTCCRSALWW
ncbi:MAG: hypothetical protein DCC75_01160 [Proteobacteria bacterium]|nr:MAG: hypothetical protein DCC75_01160 [Pseudomonadota bacterium]